MKKSFTFAALCIAVGASFVLAGCQLPPPMVNSGNSSVTTSADPSSTLPDESPFSSEPDAAPSSSQTESVASTTPPPSSEPVSSLDPPSSSQTESSSAPTETFTFNMHDVTIRKAGGTWQVYNGSVPVSSIQWRSKNPAVAVIDKGMITAISAGTTTVYAEFDGVTLSCIVRCRIPAPSSAPVSSAPTSSSPVSSAPVSSSPSSENATSSVPEKNYAAGTYETTAALNLRNGVGTGYTVKTVIPKGTRLILTRFDSGWGAASYNGFSGYVSMDYVKYISADTSAPSAGTSSGESSSGGSSSSPTLPGTTSSDLAVLRSSHIYKATRLLNSSADFTNPNAYGETAYSKSWYSADGFEETAAGRPDYAEMKAQGICCAGFVNYYLFNYLPNVAGVDTGITWLSHPNNSSVDTHTSQIRANSTSYTMNHSSWTKSYSTTIATGRDYSYIADDYAAGKLKYRVGDILTLSCSTSNYYHVAIYAGYYNGQHWIAHATDTPKGVGVTLSPFNGYCLPRDGFSIYVTEIFTP